MSFGYRVYRDSRSGLYEADEQTKGLGSAQCMIYLVHQVMD